MNMGFVSTDSGDVVHSVIRNGYKYDVFDNGTTVAHGNIQDIKAPRNGNVQRKAGGESRLSDDQGGHLVPASHNGTSDPVNIFAQNAQVNMRDIRSVERAEIQAVRNGYSIETERIACCVNIPDRPDAFMINDRMTMPDGTVHCIHSSFTNTDISQYIGVDKGLDEASLSYAAAENTEYSKAEYESILEEADNMNVPEYEDGWTSSQGYSTDMSDFGADNGYADTADNAAMDSGEGNVMSM